MVFDKQGNFVDGLKREQFAFKVEGKPREITFFDRVTAGSRSEEAQLAAARGTNAGTGPAPQPLDRGRTVLFFMDDLHLAAGSIGYARQMLKRFIDREMKQNDQVEIISSSGQLGFLQQLTNNKTVLIGAADRLRSLELNLQSLDYPPMNEYEALAIEQNNTELLDFFVKKLTEREGRIPRLQAEQIIRGRANQIIVESFSLVTRSFSTLRTAVKLAAALPGRKVMFFVSDGFLLDHNRSDNTLRLQAITDAAARSGVVIFAINARGLGAGLPDASVSLMADPTGLLSRVNFGAIRATQDGLSALANDTGGRAFLNTNSMSGAIVTALKESSTYYLLAWRPENEDQRNPKFRRIEVSVVGRPDLVVRFRRGFGEPPEEIAKDKAKDAERQPPARKAPNDEINSVLAAQYPTTAMPVAISLNFLDTAQDGGTLTTTIKVSTSSLALDPQPDGTIAAVDVAGLVLN
ncbi:MAG TPA: VWA domain-containing protein, partial [Chthoniobacterales bacterium]